MQVGGCYCRVGGRCMVVVAVMWLTAWVVAVVVTLVVDTDGSGGVVNDAGRWPLCGRQCGRVAVIVMLVVDDMDSGGGHRCGHGGGWIALDCGGCGRLSALQ